MAHAQANTAPESGLMLSADALSALASLSSALSLVQQNSHAWTYTIRGFDGSPYITRTLLPRIGAVRPMLHRIWRADADPHCHNHPWATAQFLILSGGYVEHRLAGDETLMRTLRPGDVNNLDADTFHRVDSVLPDTWTLGLVGERVQDWGFMVDGVLVPHAEYEARKGYVASQGASQS